MTTFIHYEALGSLPSSEVGEKISVVWVPGESVVCHYLQVPPVNRKKWQAMIPWLLEEHLLESPDDIAFTAGKKGQDNAVPVVAVNKKQLALWQREVADAGQESSALVPDFFALPWQQGQISVAIVGDRCLVRFNRDQGAAGPPALMLPLIERNQVGESAAVVVYFDGEKPVVDFPAAGQWRFQRVDNIFVPKHLDWISVAQGQAVRHGTGWSLPAKVAAVLVVLLLGLIGASVVIENRQVSAQVTYLQGELRKGYRQYFGGEYDFAMEDFQRVVSSQLAADGSSDPDDALALAQQLADWLKGCADCRIQRLHIRGGELTATLSGDGVEGQFTALAQQDSQLSMRPSQSGWRLSYVSEAADYE